jgi:DNA-binding response OmpR family regulator
VRDTKQILLISSDEKLNKRIFKYLPRGKYEIMCVDRADEKLSDIAEKEKNDLVIVNAGAPVWKGIKTGLMIRRLSSSPVLILSVYGTRDSQFRILDMNSDDYLSSPVEASYLSLKMERLLSDNSSIIGM